MIYLSAGHHNSDPGAVANNYRESDLTREFRDLVVKQLAAKGVKFITDFDYETNSQYQRRIKPGSGSVLLDIHFNSAASSSATGTEYIIANNASANSKTMAGELAEGTARILGIKNRGVKTEALSHRGRLGTLHLGSGVSVLAELCFMNNPSDLAKYDLNKHRLAAFVAEILIKYENLAS